LSLAAIDKRRSIWLSFEQNIVSRITIFSFAPLWFFALVPYRISEGLLINLLPLFVVQVVGGTITDVGKVNSLVALAGVIGFSFWGNLSDRVKRRRPFLMIGIAGFCLGLFGIGSGETVDQVLKASVLGGFSMAAVIPSATALVIDTVPEERIGYYFSRFYLIGGWSFIIALIVGGVWLSVSPVILGIPEAMRSLFIMAAIGAILSLILCLIWIKEPPRQHINPHREFTQALLGRLSVGLIERRVLFYPARSIYFITRPNFFQEVVQNLKTTLSLYYGCSALLFLSIQIVYIPFPLFLTQILGATNDQVLWITLARSLVETYFYLRVGQLVQSRNSIHLQALASGGRIGIFIILTLIALFHPTRYSLAIITITHLLTGLTWAVIGVSGTTSVARLSPRGQEGSAIGIYNSVIGCSTIFGSLLSVFLVATQGYVVCFGVGTVLMSLTTVCLWGLGRVTPEVSRQQ